MKLILPLLIALGLPTVVAGQTFKAVNQLTVVPLGNNTFEVIEAYGEGARGLWCAAADYTLNRSPAGAKRLYVKTARGPSVSGAGRKGVVFTTDEASLGVAPQQAVSVSVRTPGLGLPVAHAYQFCKDYQIEPSDILLRRWSD